METKNPTKTKKASRLLIAAVIFFTAGALLFCGGMFALDWDFSRLDTNEYTQQGWTNGDGSEITSLKLKITGRDVTLNVVQDGEASAEWFDSDSSKVRVSLSGGRLTVEEKFVFVFGQIFSWTNRDKNKLVVNIPADWLEKLEVSQSGGSLSVNGLKTVNKIEYGQSGGKAEINGTLQADSISFKGSGGSLRLDKIKTNSVYFKQSGGTAHLTDVEAYSFECDRSGGSLNLTRLKTDILDIKQSGGRLSGSIAGAKSDYTVTVDKSGGTCNMVKQTGLSGKKIKIRQSGGTINLSF